MTIYEVDAVLNEHVNLCPRCQAGGRATGMVTYARMCDRGRELVDDCYNQLDQGRSHGHTQDTHR